VAQKFTQVGEENAVGAWKFFSVEMHRRGENTEIVGKINGISALTTIVDGRFDYDQHFDGFLGGGRAVDDETFLNGFIYSFYLLDELQENFDEYIGLESRFCQGHAFPCLLTGGEVEVPVNCGDPGMLDDCATPCNCPDG
jgi:hypothetical protein